MATAPQASRVPPHFRHDVVEVAGLTSFSFGEDEDSRYVMIFKKASGSWFGGFFGAPLPQLPGPLLTATVSPPGICPLR